MAFDLENAVQQGFNRDITTNSFNVESNNLEVVLGIAEDGVSINDTAMFMVKDGYDIPVLISRFDGYFSVRGPAEVHGGNVLVKGTITNTGFVTLEDNTDSTSIFLFDADPDGVVVGTKGSFGTSYNDGYLYINVDDNTTWKRVAYRSEIDEIPQATDEPSGYENKDDSKMEFDDASRIFTITPRDAGYDIYLVGKKVTISNVRTTTIADTEGLHFIYYDYVDEQLKSTTSFTDDLIKKDAITAAIYWDATNKKAIYFGEERHGITMDGATHWYLHNAFGSRWLGGLALGSFTFGNGSADADAYFAVTNGRIADEDVVTNLTDDAPQDLAITARIPVYYREGALPVWRKKNADVYPFIYNGTAGYVGANGRIPYNQYTGGAWQLTEAPANNNYVLMHYFATNNLVNDTQIDAYGAPFIGIIGESVHATLAAATEAAKSEINNLYISGMPSKEFVPIATCILQTNGTYANEPNARFVVMADGSDYVDWRIEQPVPGLGVSVVDHGALTGLLDDDHPQYLRTDGTRPLSAPWDAQQPISTPEINYTGELSLVGTTGIVLDADGYDVIPANSCTDYLGDATHGWKDIYLCSGSTVIGLNDAGDTSAPNTSSGAYVVGTNDTNFTNFGPTMTGDTVQQALEAIDGYFGDVFNAITGLTWQDIYDQSCASETVVTNATCGDLIFGGTEQIVFNNDQGVYVQKDVVIDGDLTVNGTTTSINTNDMFVEDRMIRLNVGAAAGFNGTTGFEAEVGSDGYVEFHWDDSQSRWEFSIDRNAVPGSETFRPIPYLADSPGTLDLSSIGTSGYPTAGPNPDAGASVINTNATNFPYTFGPDMTDNSVQAALEAIDGYFLGLTASITGLTLQDIIDNSCPNPTIALNCGDLTINGPGELIFNTPTNITQEVNIYGGGPVNINVSGDINLDGYNVVITSTNTSTINGENGIILDGYGNNVIPMNSCTDSLGDPTHGWTEIYLCHNSTVIGLSDPGDPTAPNTTSGAELVGTNNLNFDTFGPTMTGDTVQAALEAIDGYLQGLSTGLNFTLQDIYDNSCPNPTIDLTCGDLTFTGPSTVVFSNTGGVQIDTKLVVEGTGPVVINVTDVVNISATDDINITSTQNVNINGEQGIVLDGYGQNVIPANSCTDSLGDPTHGWTDIYLCSGSNVIGLNDPGDLTAPNNDSGAYVVGTDYHNFTNFGPFMNDGYTVQQALEAIDGYLGTLTGEIKGLTLQDIYNQSCPNPTIDLTCGDLTFNGPGELVFNTPTNITQEVTITGGGPVNINVSGDINLDGYNVVITSTNTSTINGENGIILDGYGQNVIPADSCTDSLGDATHGWTDIFICHDGYVVGLNDIGPNGLPNNESGANLVGVNSENFTTFGPAMGTNDTLQGALEAIDGYLANLNLEAIGGTFTEVRGLEINGAVLNGVVKVATDAGTPALDYNWTQTSRAGWSIPVPANWDGVSDITVTVVWSPQDGTAGDVEWRLEYKSLALTELSSAAASTDDYLQAAIGTTDSLQTTGTNLAIPAAAIDAVNDKLIVINIVRRGAAGTDTYNNNAQVHLVTYSYTAKNLI